MSHTQNWLCLAVLIGVGTSAYGQDTSPLLVDTTSAVGIDFEHQDGTGRDYLFELMGAGVASFDYDNDGRCDAYLLNGTNVDPSPQSSHGIAGDQTSARQQGVAGDGTQNPLPHSPRGNYLWQQFDGGSRSGPCFRKVSSAAAVDDRGYGLGVVTADYDNDGFTDVYVTNFGANRLYRNNGDGTFVDVTQFAGVADGQKFGAGAVFIDVDLDGDLDLFSGNYVQFSFERHAELAPAAFPFPPGPKDFPAEPDTLFRNEGDGTFADISSASGISSVAGPSMGAVASDFDLDGDQDIFVCCDGEPDHLFVSDGRGNFTEEGIITGLAYDARGMANGSMGADAGDLNQDGIEDLFVTDYANQLPMLFVSQGGGFFLEQTRTRNAGRSLYPHVNWGVGMVDLDNDGDRDLLVANGHFLKDTRATHPDTRFAVPNTLLENTGAEFRELNTALNSRSGTAASSRGAAFEDFDNDGDIDVLILNCAAKAQFLENRTIASNHWLQLRLVGRRANRSAVGARVELELPDYVLAAQVHSGRGYQSDYGRALHFGLGESLSASKVKIIWPGGEIQELFNLPANQQLTIVQSP